MKLFLLSQWCSFSEIFSNEPALLIRWSKYWIFSFSISPPNENSGWIFFRIDWSISLQSKELSSVFFNTTIQKHQFFSTQLSLKMGTIKERNGINLTEAEDIKRWQEYTEELHQKYLHDPDNHDGVTTYLEPDILECKVRWALGSITMNKASGGDRIPVQLFQIQKMML